MSNQPFPITTWPQKNVPSDYGKAKWDAKVAASKAAYDEATNFAPQTVALQALGDWGFDPASPGSDHTATEMTLNHAVQAVKADLMGLSMKKGLTEVLNTLFKDTIDSNVGSLQKMGATLKDTIQAQKGDKLLKDYWAHVTEASLATLVDEFYGEGYADIKLPTGHEAIEFFKDGSVMFERCDEMVYGVHVRSVLAICGDHTTIVWGPVQASEGGPWEETLYGQ